MPPEDTKILQFNQCHKSDKAPFITYRDLESLIEKIAGCKNNSENSSTAKVGEHIPSGFLVSKILSFKSTENKYDVYRDKYFMKRFYEYLREHARESKQKMKVLTNETAEIL